MTLEVKPHGELPRLHHVWGDMSDDEAYWDSILEDEDYYEVYVTSTPHLTQGVLGLPVGPNIRVSAPPTLMTVLINDGNDVSYTGSSDGINENENIGSLAPTFHMAHVCKCG
ncbi:hypothetical protein F2Q68_00039060 [Brassica cretica]|uniref:Uncharacterized protein n=2 Tax=Brassica cretica TaxID=69181 RepID=A0A3N6UGN6_BRACR|nr:hypothetical protein F2Q68_00039060 [Brassica cretica]KAF3497267.1 hypothetical protein DY000_02052644 [Brassica cretica]